MACAQPRWGPDQKRSGFGDRELFVNLPSILTGVKVQKAEKGKINYSARTISGSAAEVVMVSVAKHAAEVRRRDG